MKIDQDIVKKAHLLNRQVHANAIDYQHSTPLARVETSLILSGQRRYSFSVAYDIKDILFIGAATQSSVLMTGDTDSGKTTLARLVMSGLLGKEEEGWHRIDIDTDFGKDALSDIDFSIITEGRKMSDGMFSAQGFLSLPGLIGDEINRTHEKLANKLIHVFDRDITLPNGSRVILGHPYAPGKTYQFQVAAINEGAEYGGTFSVDQALRRRTIIEIPMNMFRPTAADERAIRAHGTRKLELRNGTSHRDEIIAVYQALETGIPLHATADMFLSYLNSFNYCKNSLTGDKSSIPMNNGSITHICTQPVAIGGAHIGGGAATVGCNFLRSFSDSMCPHVRGLSEGVANNLQAVARGFAVIRATKFTEMMAGYLVGKTDMPLSYALTSSACSLDELTETLRYYTESNATGLELAQRASEKYIGALEIGIEDIEAATGFVAYSKSRIAPFWIGKHFQGNRYAALQTFVREARMKLQEGLAGAGLAAIQDVLKGNADAANRQQVMEYCNRENPWLGRTLGAYIPSRTDQEFEDVLARLTGA